MNSYYGSEQHLSFKGFAGAGTVLKSDCLVLPFRELSRFVRSYTLRTDLCYIVFLIRIMRHDLFSKLGHFILYRKRSSVIQIAWKQWKWVSFSC